jgi:hypothetical protein
VIIDGSKDMASYHQEPDVSCRSNFFGRMQPVNLMHDQDAYDQIVEYIDILTRRNVFINTLVSMDEDGSYHITQCILPNIISKELIDKKRRNYQEQLLD